MAGRLVGVGVGPGDPELLTLKAVRVLRAAEAVFVPATSGSDVGRAETIVRGHVPSERIRPLRFAMSDAQVREGNWDRAGQEVAAALDASAPVAFATLGDPSLYSTFTYVADSVRALRPDVVIETVPGITAMQAIAARAGIVLAEGTEPVTLLSLTAGTQPLAAALARGGTVVCYKGGSRLGEVLETLAASGRLDTAVFASHLGLPGEEVGPAAELRRERAPYLSTIIAPAPSGRRRGAKI